MNANKVCQNCNTTCAPTAKFCGNCGAALNADVDAPIRDVPFPAPSESSNQVRLEQEFTAEADGVGAEVKLVKDMIVIRKKKGSEETKIPIKRISSVEFKSAGKIIPGYIALIRNIWGKTNADPFKVYFTVQQQQNFERLREAIGREQLRIEATGVDPNSKIFPYKKAIEEGQELPTLNLTVTGAAPPVLKKNEEVHFAHEAAVNELKTVSLGYKGGSRGVSVPIPGMKGVRYRVGGYSGHVEKEERIIETSHGVLIMTNKRLFLHPAPGRKPLSISLNKILSYQPFENGLEVFIEGRQTGYFFAIDDSDSVDIFAACLGYLTSN